MYNYNAMDELNNFDVNNTKTTFSVNTNNIETSDELTADPIYQNKMGTNYSKAKWASRIIKFTGVALILTAAAIATGNFVTNGFVLNPPSVSAAKVSIEEETLNYRFVIKNAKKYKTYMVIVLNGSNVLKEDVSESKTYDGTYPGISDTDSGRFYIQFTNSFDYVKTIFEYKFGGK